MPTRALIDLNVEWVQFVLQNFDLSEVCIIKTVPHGTVSPQMMYKKYKRLVYTSPDLLARFCKINCKIAERKKLGLICFARICFPGLIYCDREPFWLLNVIEDDCYFLVVHIRLSTRCKIKFPLSLDCLQIIFL